MHVISQLDYLSQILYKDHNTFSLRQMIEFKPRHGFNHARNVPKHIKSATPQTWYL